MNLKKKHGHKSRNHEAGKKVEKYVTRQTLKSVIIHPTQEEKFYKVLHQLCLPTKDGASPSIQKDTVL